MTADEPKNIDRQALIGDFTKYLHSKGLRFTEERKDILEHIFAAHTHFEADDLQMRLREVGHRVSKATIYRTLKLLVEAGVLRQTVTPPDTISAQYELMHGQDRPHEHIYCKDCGKTFELSDPVIREHMTQHAASLGFDLEDLNVQIVGSCKELRTKGTCSRSGMTLNTDDGDDGADEA